MNLNPNPDPNPNSHQVLGKAIVAGLADESVRGVQRFPEMERLAQDLELPAGATA